MIASKVSQALGRANRRPCPRPVKLAVAVVGIALGIAAAALARSRGDKDLLLGEDADRYRTAGTWHELFDPSDLANRLPVLFWVGALVLLGTIAFPYLWLAARVLPDGGWAIARPVGLLLVVWPAWWLASLDLVEFGRTALATTSAVLAVPAAGIVIRHRSELGDWLRERWRVLAVEEAVFWVLFGAVLAVRWSNPDLWHPSLGGEKPMDFAYLNAVVKSASFPPLDPWFAGGTINYYYFGFVLIGGLVELTAIVPAVAYNLAIPTLAAFLGLAAFGAVLALVGSRRPVGLRALVSSTLAAGFVTVLGNLAQLEVVWDGLRHSIPSHWWYWNATRAIAVPAGEPAPITEFPAFTYLYADIHAHAIALPYAAVVVVLAVAVVLARRVSFGLFALLVLALGTLWPTNAWDLPTYALVALAALGVVQLTSPGARPLRAGGLALAQWGVLVASAYVLYLPFHLGYVSAFAGVERWRGPRTSLGDYLTVHGLFLFAIVSALVLDLLRGTDLNPVARLVRLLMRRPRRTLRLHRALVSPTPSYRAGTAAVAGGFLLAGLLAVFVGGAPALAVCVATLAALLLRRRRGTAGRGILWPFTIVLVLLGTTITLAVEFLVVGAIDIGRTNTVFKSYLQVWLLWGLAAAVAVHAVYGRLRSLGPGWRIAWRSSFVLLLAVALLYPVLATPAKVRDRFDPAAGRSLDGAAFMATARYGVEGVELPLADDLGAIRWMLAEVGGSPVVAEVNTYPTLYGWGNRFAMFTGNPAVIGWDFHQRQQRGSASSTAVPDRIADVQTAYGTRDAERAYELLARYGVEYAVVGRLERAYFPHGQAKWSEGVGRLWEVAFRNGGVTVYRLLGRE